MWDSSNNTTFQHNEDNFMDTSAANSSAVGTKKNSRNEDKCLPIMIAHINRYGENLAIWGVPVKLFTFVVAVCNIEVTSTKVNFTFRDETGTIKGVKWLNFSETSYIPPVQINSYARVYGMIRKQNDETYVLIVNIQPMENLNELLTHLMEVTVVCMEYEKLFKTNIAQNESISEKDESICVKDMTQMNNLHGLSEEQLLILNIIKHSDPEYGAERNNIKTRVPLNLVPKVDNILDFLSSEGHIYTTKTDDFFKIL